MITAPNTLWDLIEARATATPDAVLGIDEDSRVITYGGYRAAAERAAAGFAALGIGEGTPVSWQLPTWIESLVLVGALSRIGAVQNPMLPIYRQREVGFITEQTGAEYLIVPGEWRGVDFRAMAQDVVERVPSLEVLTVDRDLPEGDPSTLPPPPVAPANDDDAPIRWVFYTSGTTADPKGARHTDPTIKAAAYAMGAALDVQPEDVTALVFPLTHIGGISWLFTLMMSGAKSVVVEAFDPPTTIPLMQREKVTLAGAGTAFHLAYLNTQREDPGRILFPEVRCFPGGAAPKPPQLHYDLKAEIGGVGIASGYGLTECPILAMASVYDTDENLANTEGAPSPGVEIKIVKLDGSVGSQGDEGEIRVKGPQLMKGYVDGSLDAEAFDEEGYFRTGDLGMQGPEGHVYITGRLKDVIIRKGETISAKEVEDLLFTHPAIGDVAVIGIPDPKSGERAVAIVVAAEGQAAPTLADVFEFCRDAGLMTQKIPEQLELLDVLPRNATGKVLKHELRKQYAPS
jgi:acyl-CoA synthetase (AMP-forming)/AMP-acid ligase II